MTDPTANPLPPQGDPGPAPAPNGHAQQIPFQPAPYQQAPYAPGPYAPGPYAPGPYAPGPHAQGPYPQTPQQGGYPQVPHQQGQDLPVWQQQFAPRPYAPPTYPAGHPMAPMQYKDTTAAYLLWFFTGYLGGHHFYLGRTQRGVAYAVTFVLSSLLLFVIIGTLGFLALFVLWIIDGVQLSERLRQYNAHAYSVNQSMGYA